MTVPTGTVTTIEKGSSLFEGGVALGNDTWLFSFDAAMVNGTSGTGAGVAGPGSICMNVDGKQYTNTNTKASPTWTSTGLLT